MCSAKFSTNEGSAMGFPVRIEGRGTGINLFPQWCLVGTGKRNREKLGHGSVWSPREAAEGFNFAALAANFF